MTHDLFDSAYKNIISSISNKKDREKVEDIAIMAASFGVMAAVPVVGEIQMGIQVLDFIDPYGYNRGMNRQDVDSLLNTQYQKIEDAQQNIQDCFVSGNKDACKSSGITEDALQNYSSYSPEMQDKVIKMRTSWLYPTNPVARYSQIANCIISGNPDDIKSLCKDDDYSRIYNDYWNKNKDKFESDAKKAQEEAEKEAEKELISGGGEEEKGNNNIRAIFAGLFIISVIIVFIIAQKFT